MSRLKPQPIITRQRPPMWLPQEIDGRQRIWGVVVLNYPMSHIRPAYVDGNNPRLNPRYDISLIKEKLRTMGFMGTLPATPVGYDKKAGKVIYELLDGDRRYLAWKELGGMTIDLMVFEGTQKEVAPFRMAFNASSEVDGVDQAIFIASVLIGKYGYTHEQIASICSQSRKEVGRSWVTTMASIGQNCCKEVLDAWRNKKIRKTHALYISQMFNINQAGEQVQMMNDFIERDIKTSMCKKLPSKKTKSKRRNTNKTLYGNAKSMYEVVKRYEKIRSQHTSRPTEISRALLDEYKWILSVEE